MRRADRAGRGGVDTVESTVSGALSVNVEHLPLIRGSDINGIGNSNANTIIGQNSQTGTTTDNLGNTVPTFGRYTQAISSRVARLGVRYTF